MIPREYFNRIAPWWIACLIIGSFLPYQTKEALGTVNSGAAIAEGRSDYQHRLIHLLAFGSTALLLVFASEKVSRQLLGAAGVGLLGLAIEYGQFKLTEAQFPDLRASYIEWWDVRDDNLAAFAALILGQWAGLRGAVLANDRSVRSDLTVQ